MSLFGMGWEGWYVFWFYDSLLFLYKLPPLASFFSFRIKSPFSPNAVIFPRLLSLAPYIFNSLFSSWFTSSQCSNPVDLSSVLSIFHSEWDYLFLGVILAKPSAALSLFQCSSHLYKTLHTGMNLVLAVLVSDLYIWKCTLTSNWNLWYSWQLVMFRRELRGDWFPLLFDLYIYEEFMERFWVRWSPLFLGPCIF